ncbi:MAG: LysM peptidoglycan-binding domain-containing protein [Anaerolineae bacterium]
MNARRLLILFLLVALLLVGLALPAGAAPAGQLPQYLTPTPGPDGRILYIVREGDTCFLVAALHGMTVDQLRALNSKLDAACTLIPGQELLIGVVNPGGGTPTAGPSPTPATPTVTPTPFTGTTEICVLLFDDQNGDALREGNEPPIAGGAVSVTEVNGKYSAALDTAIPSDPTVYPGVCFTDVPEGEYTISVAIPDTYNPTMNLSYRLKVNAGDRAFVDFGAQSKEKTAVSAEEKSNGGTSTLLGALGILLLLSGGGLGWYAWQMRKPASRLGGSGLLKKRR